VMSMPLASIKLVLMTASVTLDFLEMDLTVQVSEFTHTVQHTRLGRYGSV
jgi:hypothetical protein